MFNNCSIFSYFVERYFTKEQIISIPEGKLEAMRLKVATNLMMFGETCNMGLSFTIFVPLHKVVNLIKDKYYIVILLFYYVNQQTKLKK